MGPRAFLAVALSLALVAPVVGADERSDAKAQVEFGISVVQHGLWQEALYRWRRAVEIDPSYAAPGTILESRTNTRDSSTTLAKPTKRRSNWSP